MGEGVHSYPVATAHLFDGAFPKISLPVVAGKNSPASDPFFLPIPVLSKFRGFLFIPL